MPKSNQNDPYVYSGTSTLINKFDIRDFDRLQELEGIIFALKCADPLPSGNYDYDHLKSIHYHFFHELYEWAGQERTIDISKENSFFAHYPYITSSINRIFIQLKKDKFLVGLRTEEFCNKLSYYFNEINAVHPFREGNGRTQRAFCDVISEQAGYILDWTFVDRNSYLEASILGFTQSNYEAMKLIFRKIVSSLDRIRDLSIDIALSVKAVTFLKDYVEKQVLFTHLTQKKLNSNLDSKQIAEKAHQLSKHLKNVAKELLEDQTLKNMLKELHMVTLQGQGGFTAIHERFQKNSITVKDVLAVLNFAKSNIIAISESLRQERRE